MATIAEIKKEIQTKMKEIEANNAKLSEDNKNLLGILETINLYLEENKLEETIEYIRSIPVKDILFSNKIATKVKTPFSWEAFLQTIPTIKDAAFLIKIHNALMNNIDWTYSYPLYSGEVLSDAVQAWRESQTMLEGNEAFVDFKRDSSINGQSRFASDADIMEKIQALVDATKAYNESEKKLLSQWIGAQGGQGNAALLGECFRHFHFYREDKDEYPSPGNNASSINWSVKKGKLICEVDSTVTSVILPTQGFLLIKNKEGEVERKPIGKYVSENPLMRAKITIQLEIIDNKVIPKVTSFFVSSYTNELHKPEIGQALGLSKKGVLANKP